MALTDIKVKPMDVTWNSVDLGSTSGGVEVSIEVQSTDIVTDQDGTSAMDAYQTGVNVTLSMTLLELNTTNYNQMIAQATGNSVVGTDATVYGMGTDRNFTSMLSRCQTLRLRPVGNGADESEDVTFWKAIPILESLTFAPDSANQATISFRIFRDSSKDAGVSLFAIGDVTGV